MMRAAIASQRMASRDGSQRLRPLCVTRSVPLALTPATDGKLKAVRRVKRWCSGPNPHHNPRMLSTICPLNAALCMFMKFLLAHFARCCCRRWRQAADITGIPKIRDGDQILIGSTRIRLGGIDAPSVGPALPQHQGRALDLRRRRARRTDHTHRQQELDLPRPRRPTAAAARWRDARSTARTSRNGW